MRYIQKSNATRLFIAAWMISTLFYATGCCCNSMVDCYGNKIDSISDHLSDIHFDRFYHAECDVSRIGKADWCSSSINRMLCPGSCGCQTCQSCQNQSCGCQSACNSCETCTQEMPCAACEMGEVSEPFIIEENMESVQPIPPSTAPAIPKSFLAPIPE